LLGDRKKSPTAFSGWPTDSNRRLKADGLGVTAFSDPRRFRAMNQPRHDTSSKFNFARPRSFAIRYSPFVIISPTPVFEPLSPKIHEIQLCSGNLFFFIQQSPARRAGGPRFGVLAFWRFVHPFRHDSFGFTKQRAGADLLITNH